MEPNSDTWVVSVHDWNTSKISPEEFYTGVEEFVNRTEKGQKLFFKQMTLHGICSSCMYIIHIYLYNIINYFNIIYIYIYMGQCPAKSGLWGYKFITIKIARCTKQSIFATVQPFPFRFRPPV